MAEENWWDKYDTAQSQPAPEEWWNKYDPDVAKAPEKELDSAWDFSGERTLVGRFLEGNKAVPRQFLTTGLSGIGGLAVQQIQNKKIQENLLSNLDEYPTAKRFAKYALKTVTNPTRFPQNIANFAVETGTGKEVADVPLAEKVLEGAVYSADYLNNESILKGDEKYADLWTTKLGGGAGSLGAFMLAGLGGPATLIPFASGTGTFEQYERLEKAKEAGIDISLEEESLALGLGAVIGMSEAFTPLRLLRAVPRNIPLPERKKILKAFTDYFKTNSGEILKTGAGEGGQEVFASLAQSLVEMGYNPNAELPSGQSLFDDFTIGAVLGAGAKGGSNVIQQRRFNAMSDVELERERKAIEWENAQNALAREKILLIRQQRELEKTDPVAFAEASRRAREQAFKVAPPSEEEVKQFNAPSAFGPVVTPSAFGELYALRTIGSLGQSFPTSTSFEVKEIEGPETAVTNPDGTQGVQKKPLFTVTDLDGNQYGQPLENAQAASSMASTLNKEVQSKGIRNSILDTLMVSPQGYTPEQSDKLFRYGFRVLSPDSNRVTFAALNEAAGTTTENGYIEDLPVELVASAKKLRDGRYQVQMPDGTQRYITGLTASQELNLKRLQQGLPAATTFDITEARDALGGDVGRLALPGVSGIQDSLNYGAKVIDGKPVVISEANEVITQRRTTASEKARAGVDEDGNSVLPDYIEFKTFDEAKRYAGRLNQRTGTSRVLPTEILEGKEDIASEIKSLLDTKNIDAEIGSPELNQLVKAFTGAETFSDMTVNDQKLFYNRLRNLPKFNERTKVPVFKQKLFTPQQFVEVVRFVNEYGFTPSKAYVGAVMGLDKSDPNYDAATESLLEELKRQNESVSAEQRRFEEEVVPLREKLQEVLTSFGLSPDMLNLGTRLYDRDTGEDITATNEGGSEGYFDPAFEEIVMAIDAIDIEGNKTQEQRLDELKGVVGHEAIHALRTMGMFTQKEYAILETAVSRTIKPGKDMTYLQWARRPRSQGGYFEDRPTVQVEEAIADMFRDFLSNRKLIGGKPRNLMERIINFFQKLRNMVEGYGFKTFSDVLASIESGEIGRRQRARVVTKEDGTQELVGPVRSLRKTEALTEKYQRMLPGRYQKFGDIFEQGPTVTPLDVPEENVPTEDGRMGDFDPSVLEGAEVRMSRKDANFAIVENDTRKVVGYAKTWEGAQRAKSNKNYVNGEIFEDKNDIAEVRDGKVNWDSYDKRRLTKQQIEAGTFQPYSTPKKPVEVPKPRNPLKNIPDFIDVDGVQRPSTNSDGDYIFKGNNEFSAEEGLRNFWRWFGDSKIVDEYGRPEILYHGSDADFETFIPSKSGGRGGGVYFAAGKGRAKDYGKYTYPAYLRVVNPADEETLNQYMERVGEDSVSEELAKDGYDGVDSWDVVVYQPNQIKSATKNTGAFSEKDDSIRYSRKALPATIDVDGVQRPTTNSNGQQIDDTEENVRNFWKWFGDSKMVDGRGRPIVYYHGTRNNFDAFKGMSLVEKIKKYFRVMSSERGGDLREILRAKQFGTHFFTDNAELASDYALMRDTRANIDDSPNVLPVYLKLERPVIIDLHGQKDGTITLPNGKQQTIEHGGLKNWLLANRFGYSLAEVHKADGFISRNVFDSVNPADEKIPGEYEVIVTFDPNQSKSAISNTGAYSLKDSRLSYSRKAVPATIDVNGKERPTTNNKGQVIFAGNDIYTAEEGIRNFWRGFGDSVVVDSEGRPKQVYHATRKNFDVFGPQYRELGWHFGASPEQGEDRIKNPLKTTPMSIGLAMSVYGIPKEKQNEFWANLTQDEKDNFEEMVRDSFDEFLRNGNVMPVYLSIQNPIYFPKDIGNWRDMSMLEYYLTLDKIPKPQQQDIFTKSQFKRFKNDDDVRNALMKKGYDGIIYKNLYENTGADPEAYIIFEDNQIKSSMGNKGSFSRFVGDINYSRKSVSGASKDLQGQGRVLFEVAPSPENKVRAGVWSGMPKADKVAITRKIGPMAIREVAGIFDIPMSAFKQPILGQGLFEGVVNPNQILGIKTNKVRPEQAIQVASALGYVLEQKAMVVADGRMTGKETSLVRIYTKGDAMAVADRLYDLIKQEVGDFGGYSAFNDHIDIMNFSSIDSRELASRFTDIINEKASDVDVTVRHAKIQSAYIEERKYASSIYSGTGRANREGLERRLDSARSRIIQRLESEISNATGQPAAATDTGEVRFSRRVRGSSGVLQQPSRPYQKNGRAGKSLEGLPKQIKVDGRIVEFDAFSLAQKVAERYMRKAGLPYIPPTKYVSIDPAMSVSIAEEFERMQHDPQNPLVIAAYRQMMAETAAQYREIMKTGLKVEFIKGDDPYGNPRNAILDIVQNNHFSVFSTKDGFGSNDEMDTSDNPLLEETEFKDINGETMLANDLFRVVHDYFGHALSGVGFRATGEENAWRSHASMYTPLARRAMTSETRGQNSYVNFGPNGEFNRTASPADTIYADQKVGLMPEWVSTDTYETGAVMPEPEQAAPEQISQEALAEAVAKAEEDTKNTGTGAVPLYGKNASPEALYIAQNPEQAATLTREDEVRYSRRNTPNYSPRARQIIDKNTPRPPDEPVGRDLINMMGFPETRDMWDGLRAGIFNRYARIERITRENEQLASQLADVGSYAAIEMADRSRFIMQAAAAEGVPVYENGMFRVKDFFHKGKKIRGLIDLDAMLFSEEYGNLEELAQAYATAVRGERLNSEGKLTPVSPGELAELKKEVEKFINPKTGNPIVLEWFDAWQNYNSYVVKFLRDTGVIDEAGAALWLKQADYVPFYREDVNGNLVHPRVFGGLHTAGQFKAVGKSDKAINVDMRTAIFNNIDVAIAMGMKNVAQQRVIRDLEKLGLATMLKSGEQVGNRQSINFKVKGKQYTALIEDPLLYESLLPVSELDLGEFTEQILSLPAETWRELITRNPDFGFANAFRDSVSAFMITGANIVPVLSSVKYFFAPLSEILTGKRFLRDISELEKMGIISGRGGYDLGKDAASVKKFYAKELKRRQSNISWWKNPLIAAWDALGRFTERTEAATRLAVYNDVLKRSGSPAEAQYQAISVMNYARRGNNKILRFISKAVPFTNANLQGKDKLYQAVTGRIGARYVTDSDGNVSRNASRALNRAVFAGRALLMVASTVLYYAMVYDDDEYLTASPEMRDNYYILPITNGDIETGEPGLSLKLPIAFDVGSLFKVIPERIMASTMGQDSTRDFNQSMMRELKKQLFGGVPINIKPIYEAYVTNYESFTSRPVVPTFMENLEPEQQKTFYTNKAIEKVATLAGVSPMRLEHVITGYMPGLGAYLLQALDSTARYLDGPEAQKPAVQWFQLPGIKRFFTTANQPGLVNQFYDLKDNVDGIVQTINRLEKEGRDDELAVFYAKNGHMYEMRRELNSIERQIKQLRDERKIIEEMAIDQESKRVLIEEINMQINASLLTIPMLRQEAFGSSKEE